MRVPRLPWNCLRPFIWFVQLGRGPAYHQFRERSNISDNFNRDE